MTVWTEGRIPIWVPPLPGETLDSWIEAYAERLRATSREFLNHLGMGKATARQLTVRLSPAEQTVISRATGVAPAAVDGMTLSRYDGIAITIRDEGKALGHPPHWRMTAGSRFCPPCLQEDRGRWQLAWRVPWTFVCLRHSVVLLDLCPRCATPPMAMGRVRHRPTTRGDACSFPLDTLDTGPLPSAGRLPAAQNAVDRLLSAPDRQGLQDLYILARQALLALRDGPERSRPGAVDRILDEYGHRAHRPPETLTKPLAIPDAGSVAVGSSIALAALRNSDDGEGRAVLEWITRAGLARRRTAPGEALQQYRAASPALSGRVLAAADPHLRAYDRLTYASASPRPKLGLLTVEDLRLRASRVPSLLWPSWSMRLADFGAVNTRPEWQRTALSAMLMVPGSPPGFTYTEAGNLLDVPQGLDLVKRVLSDDTRHAPVLSAIAQLATALDLHGSPIDYARRRRTFHRGNTRIDRDAYEQVRLRHAWRTRNKRRMVLLDYYLLALLTGSGLDTVAGERITSLTLHQGWNGLRLAMPPAFKDFFHQQAEGCLTAHGIDEPVQWEPPASWVTDVSWPGAEPGLIDLGLVRDLAAQGASAGEAIARLRIGHEDLRLLTEISGITFTGPAPEQGPGRPRPRQGVLAPERLRQLYLDERKNAAQIAILAGCHPTTVQRALTQAGIPLRRIGADAHEFLTREWLAHEYTERGRTLADIAEEAGVSQATIIRRATTWNIPRRPPGTPGRTGQ
ncbi:TniQ family protein [Streptomyces sp. NPDC002225]|uniref:TniQ family protein n=1 Tax=Streptomyces sp. NPDC002225 TaxID=3154413 RepID=UPI00332FAB5E